MVAPKGHRTFDVEGVWRVFVGSASTGIPQTILCPSAKGHPLFDNARLDDAGRWHLPTVIVPQCIHLPNDHIGPVGHEEPVLHADEPGTLVVPSDAIMAHTTILASVRWLLDRPSKMQCGWLAKLTAPDKDGHRYLAIAA